MKYFFLLTSLLLILSCKNRIDVYKKEAHTKVHKILVQAQIDVNKELAITPFVEYHQMDSIQFDSIIDQLTSETAAAYYQSDMAFYTTEDCVDLPSSIQERKEKEIATSDSIYYYILTAKLKELRAEKNLNSFIYSQHLVYNKRIHLISLEMAKFCSEERFENFKNWRERIKPN